MTFTVGQEIKLGPAIEIPVVNFSGSFSVDSSTEPLGPFMYHPIIRDSEDEK